MSNDQLSQIYIQFEEFSYDTDPNFLEGLSGILNSEATQDFHGQQKAYMIGCAKVFYFNRSTGNNIKWDEYVKWVDETRAGSTASDVEEPRPATPRTGEAQTKELTFAEITELIQSGNAHLIPNNETIPGGLNESPPSKSSLPIRKKPWEALNESEDNPPSTPPGSNNL